jgi:hypothetical protein
MAQTDAKPRRDGLTDTEHHWITLSADFILAMVRISEPKFREAEKPKDRKK